MRPEEEPISRTAAQCVGCGETFVRNGEKAYCPDCKPGAQDRTIDVVEYMQRKRSATRKGDWQ